MSSEVLKSERIKKPARKSFKDFSKIEQKVIKSVSSWYPGKIGVFGSRAKGTWAEDSDLDIGVEGFKSFRHRNVRDYISNFYGIRVDLRSFNSVKNREELVIIDHG